MDDYLALAPALVARIADQLPDLVRVSALNSLEDVADELQRTPAAFVIYDGDTLPQGDKAQGAQGAKQEVLQRWLVVLAVKSAKDTATGAGTRTIAGPLLWRLIVSLSGWAPPAELSFRPLSRTNAPAPEYLAGFAFYPLAFTAKIFTP